MPARATAANPGGLLDSGSGLPTPATTLSDVVSGTWASLRRIQRQLFNRVPTLAPHSRCKTTMAKCAVLWGHDVDGDVLTYHLADGPAHGSVTLSGDGSYVYTPDADFAHIGGTDSFTVTVDDTTANAPHLHGLKGLLPPWVSLPNPSQPRPLTSRSHRSTNLRLST